MGTQGAKSNSRLYVGGVSHTVQSKDLEELFGKYGKILEVRMNRSFAFVQFSEEQAAQEAVAGENGTSFFGKKIDVQFARAPRITGDKSNDQDVGRDRDRSPIRENRDRFELLNYGGRGRGGRGGVGPGGGGGIGRLSPWASDQSEPPRDLMSLRGGRGGGRGGGGFRGGGHMGPPMDRGGGPGGGVRGDSDPGGPPPGGPFSGRGAPGGPDQFQGGGPGGGMHGGDGPGGGGMMYRGGDMGGGNLLGGPPFRSGGGGGPIDSFSRQQPPQLPPNSQPKPLAIPNAERVNDIEVIVLNKAITDYGEFIERKLKALGFTVDVLFPNEEVPMGRVLGNIASRGTLYSVIVSPVHQQNRSLTLHILHGLPQEHRNMPIEDAITLVSRNFESYIYQCKEKQRTPNAPPENIRHLLEQVIAGRELTVAQYDKLVQYFSLMMKEKERSDPAVLKVDPTTTSSQEAELQNRILNILNKSGSDGPPPSVPVPTPVQPPSGAGPLLQDPSVQKALDSLIQGDLLRKISNPGQPQHQYQRY